MEECWMVKLVPVVVDELPGQDLGSQVFVVDDTTGAVVCELTELMEDAEPTAHVVAAAPKMLEILKRARTPLTMARAHGIEEAHEVLSLIDTVAAEAEPET